MSFSSRPITVHKFGGAALADAASIANVGQLLASDDSGAHRVVVTSALQGVTNDLVRAIELATSAAPMPEVQALVEAIRTRHLVVCLRRHSTVPATATPAAMAGARATT